MPLILITGPMKSGKSLELISRMSLFEHSRLHALLIQPALNVRDEVIRSRLGPELAARKVDSLSRVQAEAQGYDVIGIDEAFMFPLEDIEYIKKWLLEGKTLIVSTLDISGMGNMLDLFIELYKLGPEELIVKTAVCEACQAFGAQFTQITKNGLPTKGLPDVVPEDGSYEYRPACRSCFHSIN